VRVQVDDDASPGVLCVSVRVAVFGGRVGSGGGGGGCTGCFRRVTLLVTLDRYFIRIVLVYSNYLPAGVGW
jgi:hypothetical protein